MALRWLSWLPPRSLVALVMALAAFSMRLAACHITHSPTLEVDTCHALCRLLGLLTTVVAYKFECAEESSEREWKLRNTFGWARIEVVGRLCVHVLFASLAFNMVVSAVQLCVHTSHTQPPCDPHPRVTIAAAVVGLVVHMLGYVLLAGQELSYGRRLSVTESGGVVVKTGGRLDILAYAPSDIISCAFVVTAGLVSSWANAAPDARTHVCNEHDQELHALRLADPALSALASIVLVACTYPFLRESGMVVLQTVPEGLGQDRLLAEAERVPGVLAVHELHVWQLYPSHVVATAHVFYASHADFHKSSSLVAEVFTRHGISLVTLQPEFGIGKEHANEEELKQVRERARQGCGAPCSAHCAAPRCCVRPPALPPAVA